MKTNEQAPFTSGMPQQRATLEMLGGHFFATQPLKKSVAVMRRRNENLFSLRLAGRDIKGEALGF